MLSYKNDLRLSVLAALGKTDISMLTTRADESRDIDSKIVRLASRALKKSELTAFYFAFHCTPTWEEI
jgi:hypothetical protein